MSKELQARTAADSSTNAELLPSANLAQNPMLAAVINPSVFCTYPWGSVMQNSESETIALNIMTILKRTGDVFREITWDEYKNERLKDGRFSDAEKVYFNNVIPYCKTADTARLFCREWSNCC